LELIEWCGRRRTVHSALERTTEQARPDRVVGVGHVGDEALDRSAGGRFAGLGVGLGNGHLGVPDRRDLGLRIPAISCAEGPLVSGLGVAA
jgi:hypothetical protein